MNSSLDHNSATPLYAQAEKLLREMIKEPAYQEGKLLPNEIDMAKKLGISRNTLRQATNKLVYEGLIFRKKGVGTIVTHPVDSKAQNWMSFSQEMKNKGIKIVNFDINHAWVQPDSEVQNFLGIPEGTPVLKMERLRGGEDGPFVFFISYFHPRTGLTGEEDFTRPLYDILREDHSIHVNLSKEEITARAADPKLAKKLNLETGEPILARKRFVYDPGRRPIEYNIGFYRADSFVYSLESIRT
ncbi:MAG: GntR family transcriptional regulator [Reichenbachiella sp.]